MNGNLFLLDTNIVLYILGNKIKPDMIPDGKYCISFITEMELLSFPLLKEEEEKIIHKFIKSIDVIEMNEFIKDKAILFRKTYQLKLPDAIICSTASCENAVLVTNDRKLGNIKEIENAYCELI